MSLFVEQTDVVLSCAIPLLSSLEKQALCYRVVLPISTFAISVGFRKADYGMNISYGTDEGVRVLVSTGFVL